MRILIATDAWHPQVNGVVRTYERLAPVLTKLGVELAFLTPADFTTVPCPTYPEIRLALPSAGTVARRFEAHQPVAVHIATEGPVGWMARSHCLARRIPFTTSFHTRFPDYIAHRTGLPASTGQWCAARRCTTAGKRRRGCSSATSRPRCLPATEAGCPCAVRQRPTARARRDCGNERQAATAQWIAKQPPRNMGHSPDKGAGA